MKEWRVHNRCSMSVDPEEKAANLFGEALNQRVVLAAPEEMEQWGRNARVTGAVVGRASLLSLGETRCSRRSSLYIHMFLIYSDQFTFL
jgi:hypothetical protein